MSAALDASGAPRLEKYEVLEEIGHGGMATVYRARDPRLGRDVAIKVIHKHLRENAEVATRFVAEARAAAKLRHRGIVEVFDVSSEDDAERFLVVELLRGTTLRKIVQKHRDMPAEIGAAIALELCEALEHAHESGIIHRDVKPENVLVECPCDRVASRGTPRPARRAALEEAIPDPPVSAASSSKKGKSGDLGVVIKLTDFGIAKILDAQGVTSTGQVLGSPAHMAPEQIEGGDVDARTDVFALGVLMYECLVGHLPFEGKNPAQVLRRVLDGIYARADRERPTVGGRWAKILAGALAREAVARTPTPAALGEQIRAELEDLAVGDPREAINDYFADPAAYSDELTKRLVPRLVARGEAARKRGDVEGAAADFNRALALAPTDLTILKRVTSLTSSESRRALLRRGGMVLGGTAVMALLSFGVVRWARARHDSLPPASSADAIHPDPGSSAQAAVSPDDSSALVAPKPSGASMDQAKRPPIRPRDAQPIGSTVVAGTAPGASTRMVKLVVIPKAATVSEGGNAVDAATGVPHSMSVGVHTFAVSVVGSKCCKPLSFSQAVSAPPADKPDEVQTIRIKLDMMPTSVSLLGAPAGATLSCPGVGLSVSQGPSSSVTLTETEWSGTCKFAKADGSAQAGHVVLRAGESMSVPWAGD